MALAWEVLKTDFNNLIHSWLLLTLLDYSLTKFDLYMAHYLQSFAELERLFEFFLDAVFYSCHLSSQEQNLHFSAFFDQSGQWTMIFYPLQLI